METKLKLFNEKTVRTAWNADEEEWYFSVVDVVEVLTDSANPTDYLKKMRKRDNELAAFLGTNCPQVEMIGETGKNERYLQPPRKASCGLFSQSLPRKPNLSKSGWRKSARNALTKLPTPKRRFNAARHTTAKRDIQTSGSVSGFAPSRSERNSPTNGAPAAWKRISNTQYSQTT